MRWRTRGSPTPTRSSAIRVSSRPGRFFPRRDRRPRRPSSSMPTLAEPHASLAYVKFYFDWDWAGAEREFQRAIELNPNYATAHDWYAYLLTATGRLPEARAEIKRAHELDPLSGPDRVGHGLPPSLQLRAGPGGKGAAKGPRDESPVPARAPLPRPGLSGEGALRAGHRRIPGDRTAPRNGSRRSRGSGMSTGSRASARKRSRFSPTWRRGRRKSTSPLTPWPSFMRRSGDKDQAFAWLGKGIEERTHWLVWLKTRPALGADPFGPPLRGDDPARRTSVLSALKSYSGFAPPRETRPAGVRVTLTE